MPDIPCRMPNGLPVLLRLTFGSSHQATDDTHRITVVTSQSTIFCEVFLDVNQSE